MKKYIVIFAILGLLLIVIGIIFSKPKVEVDELRQKELESSEDELCQLAILEFQSVYSNYENIDYKCQIIYGDKQNVYQIAVFEKNSNFIIETVGLNRESILTSYNIES